MDSEKSEEIKTEISFIENSQLLHELANQYNWDDGLDIPLWIINNKYCELATALMLFYDAGGYELLEKGVKDLNNVNNEWNSFILMIFDKLCKHEFKSLEIFYEPDLTKVQKYKLTKINPKLSNIFFDGVVKNDAQSQN